MTKKLEAMKDRLNEEIKKATDKHQFDFLKVLLRIRDGSPMGRTDRGSNVAKLYDRERKMKGW